MTHIGVEIAKAIIQEEALASSISADDWEENDFSILHVWVVQELLNGSKIILNGVVQDAVDRYWLSVRML